MKVQSQHDPLCSQMEQHLIRHEQEKKHLGTSGSSEAKLSVFELQSAALQLERPHSPASWAEDEAEISLSGRGSTCLGIAGTEGGSHPNPGIGEPPAYPAGVPGREKEEVCPLVVRLSSWCWGSGHP